MKKKEVSGQVEKFDKKDIEENKIVAALSYVGILVLIPLLAKKESKFCQAHAKQGLSLLIVFIALGIFSVIPLLGWIFGPLIMVVWGVFGLVAFIKALVGEYWEIPIVWMITKKLNL